MNFVLQKGGIQHARVMYKRYVIRQQAGDFFIKGIIHIHKKSPFEAESQQ